LMRVIRINGGSGAISENICGSLHEMSV
jgi:hypothetical protein